MTDLRDENVYSRSSILQWVADIFSQAYGNFSDVPAKDVAVLLYAIFNNPNAESTDSPTVSLHNIQFCDNPTPTTLFLNAKRVLSLVQTLSTSNNSLDSSTNCQSRTPTIGNMTPYAWMEGKSFVEELKMWRWIRAEAFKRGLDKKELETRVQSFLQGAVIESGTTVPSEPVPSIKEEGDRTTHEHLSNVSHKRQREEKEKNTSSLSMCTHSANDHSVVPQRAQTLQESSLEYLSCSGTESAPHLLEVLKSVKKELKDKRTVTAAAAEPITGEDKEGIVDEVRTSGHKSLACTSCPAIFALAVEKNVEAIEKLESVRRMAIAACLKKDARSLMDLLAGI